MKTSRCTGLLGLALASLLLAVPAQAARLALVIGHDSYQQVSPLKNAGNDAKLMAGALRSAGFDVSDHFNLDRNRLYEAIDGFQKRLGKGDEVVFYFSGHGVQVDNDPMLLPTDIQANDEKNSSAKPCPCCMCKTPSKMPGCHCSSLMPAATTHSPNRAPAPSATRVV